MLMAKLDPREALQNNIKLIQSQIEKIELEIEQRKTLSEKILAKLNERLETYYAVRNNPSALPDYSPGEGFLKDREHVNELIRLTRKEICIEERTCFNDLQKLQWEKRNLEREKAQLEFNLHLLKRNSSTSGGAP